MLLLQSFLGEKRSNALKALEQDRYTVFKHLNYARLYATLSSYPGAVPDVPVVKEVSGEVIRAYSLNLTPLLMSYLAEVVSCQMESAPPTDLTEMLHLLKLAVTCELKEGYLDSLGYLSGCTISNLASLQAEVSAYMLTCLVLAYPEDPSGYQSVSEFSACYPDQYKAVSDTLLEYIARAVLGFTTALEDLSPIN